jgi:xanthosine utilization system XapX-like protein
MNPDFVLINLDFPARRLIAIVCHGGLSNGLMVGVRYLNLAKPRPPKPRALATSR